MLDTSETGPIRPGRRLLWRRLLRCRNVTLGCVLASVVLTLPSLRAGWLTDDHYQRWVLSGDQTFAGLRGGTLEMFLFFDGDAARTRRMMELGMASWWTYPELRACFWRPISAATHWADYRLWPQRAAWMHAHSVAWYALLAAAVALLYRRMMGATLAALLASLMFVIDDAHALPVGWLASRNAVVAATFGVLTILAHRRWRESASSPRGAAYGVLATLLLAASLLSAEAGTATLGYLVAYAVVMERRGSSWAKRAATLLPYAIVVLSWRIAWSAGGYGVSAWEELYTDPLRDPLGFVRHAVVRGPLLLLGQIAYPPAEVAVVLNDVGDAVFALLGVGVAALLAYAMRDVLRRSRVARFWALGMLLAVIPMCAAFASNRQMLLAGIGGFGLLGQFLSMAVRRLYWSGLSRRRRLARFALVAALVSVHFVAAPAVLLIMSRWPMGPPEMWQASHEVPGITAADRARDVIIVNHPLPPNTLHTMCDRAVTGRALPRRLIVLAPSSAALIVRRTNERTLEIRAADGLFPDPFSRLFYSRSHAPRVNEAIELPTMRVTVLERTADHRPRAMRFEFRVSLEDDSLKWLAWRGGGYGPFTPPPVGCDVELPAGRFPF
jgi:hypothetical protein